MGTFIVNVANVVEGKYNDYFIWLEWSYTEGEYVSYGPPITLDAIKQLKESIDRVLSKSNSESE